MSLTYWRRAQDGGYGDGHSDLLILWGENEVAMCLSSTPPQISTREAENGETAERAKEHALRSPLGQRASPWAFFPLHLSALGSGGRGGGVGSADSHLRRSVLELLVSPGS